MTASQYSPDPYCQGCLHEALEALVLELEKWDYVAQRDTDDTYGATTALGAARKLLFRRHD